MTLVTSLILTKHLYPLEQDQVIGFAWNLNQIVNIIVGLYVVATIGSWWLTARIRKLPPSQALASN